LPSQNTKADPKFNLVVIVAERAFHMAYESMT
jgi:DNA-directed RNA polymerase subunit K/omega